MYFIQKNAIKHKSIGFLLKKSLYICTNIKTNTRMRVPADIVGILFCYILLKRTKNKETKLWQ